MTDVVKFGRPTRMFEPQPTLDGEGTEPLADAVIRMVRAGATLADACGCVYPPLGKETYLVWMRRGEAEHERIEAGGEPNPGEAHFVDFRARVEQAKLHAKVEAIMTIREAITGMDEVETTTVTVKKPTAVVDQDGEEVVVFEELTTTTEKRSKKKYWTAAMLYLERKHPREYARVTRDISQLDDAEPQDIEARRQRALEIVDELRTKREQRALDETNAAAEQ